MTSGNRQSAETPDEARHEPDEGVPDGHPWFAPLCRQPRHEEVEHNEQIADRCDCPCHDVDPPPLGPWWTRR